MQKAQASPKRRKETVPIVASEGGFRVLKKVNRWLAAEKKGLFNAEKILSALEKKWKQREGRAKFVVGKRRNSGSGGVWGGGGGCGGGGGGGGVGGR